MAIAAPIEDGDEGTGAVELAEADSPGLMSTDEGPVTAEALAVRADPGHIAEWSRSLRECRDVLAARAYKRNQVQGVTAKTLALEVKREASSPVPGGALSPAAPPPPPRAAAPRASPAPTPCP